MTFQEYYKSLGLNEYPFSTFSSEQEKSLEKNLFLPPNNYETVIEAFRQRKTFFIIGNRGIGKTALADELLSLSNEDNEILCFIDDYSNLEEDYTLKNVYEFLFINLVPSFFKKMVGKNNLLKQLSEDDRFFLSYLYKNYFPTSSKRELIDKIKKIKYKPVKRFFIKNAIRIKLVLNYGFTVAANILNDVISKHFSVLPPVQEKELRIFMPELPDESSEIDSEITYAMLDRFLRICKQLGFNNVIAFFDKLDEDSRHVNDAESISNFYQKILTDNKLLLNSNIQLIFTIWSTVYRYLKDSIRSNKFYTPPIKWSAERLIDVLDKRLEEFSDHQIDTFNVLFDFSVDQEKINKILFISNNNPRDLWHIFDYMLHAQYESNPKLKITSEAIKSGLSNFVKEFNYYEYYPRRKYSTASSLDIYSYIKFLLRAKKIEFTRNQFKELTGVSGSSVSNYVGDMNSMGILVQNERTDRGALVYQINDPKIQYAIENEIEINKM